MRRAGTPQLKRRLRLLLSFTLLSLFGGGGGPVHQLGQSYIFLGVYDEGVHVRIEITAEDLTKALAVEVDTREGQLDSPSLEGGWREA